MTRGLEEGEGTKTVSIWSKLQLLSSSGEKRQKWALEWNTASRCHLPAFWDYPHWSPLGEVKPCPASVSAGSVPPCWHLHRLSPTSPMTLMPAHYLPLPHLFPAWNQDQERFHLMWIHYVKTQSRDVLLVLLNPPEGELLSTSVFLIPRLEYCPVFLLAYFFCHFLKMSLWISSAMFEIL